MNIQKINAALLLTIFILVGVSCKKKEGVKFDPSNSVEQMSDAEREAAIAARRASLAMAPDSLFAFEGLKFSILPPTVSANVPTQVVEGLVFRLISIAGQNGVGGLCTNPVLGLASQVVCEERAMSGTAPQKAVVKYTVTLYCGNFVSNEIYASTTFAVTGVGSTFESAAMNAVNDIGNTAQIEEMFRNASQRALSWYNQPGNVSRLVDRAVADQNYALAMALLESVPSQADSAIVEYAIKKNAEVTALFFEDKAEVLYSKMRSAIAASDGSYNPEVGAYFTLIPRNSKVYEQASKTFTAYADSVASERKANIRRERELVDRQMADNKEITLAILANEKYKESLEFEIAKIKAPFEAAATIAQINADSRVGVAQAEAEGKKNANTGGFLGLGKLWDGGFNLANRIMDKICGEDKNDED